MSNSSRNSIDDLNPIFSNNAGTFINCISIDFCTEEPRYLQQDSHFIQIPVRLFNSMISLNNSIKEPLYIGIQNSFTQKRLYFGRVEPSIKSPNSTSDMCIMPNWVLEKLGLDLIGGKVDIVMMTPNVNIQKLGFIKIRGEKSDYVNWSDIKEKLEEKIGQFNCLNNGDHFIIDSIKFTVTELKDKNNNLCDYGCTFNTEVKLEFELPDDLIEKEKKEKKEKREKEKLERENQEKIEKREKQEKIEKREKEKKKGNNSNGIERHGMRLMTFNDVKNGDDSENNGENSKCKEKDPFEGPGLKLGSTTSTHIDFNCLNDPNLPEKEKRLIQKRIREERAKLLESRMERIENK